MSLETMGVERVKVRVLPDGRMTRNDAARYLGFEAKTLSNLAFQGKGPRWVRVSGRVFYYKEDLDAYIHSDVAP